MTNSESSGTRLPPEMSHRTVEEIKDLFRGSQWAAFVDVLAMVRRRHLEALATCSDAQDPMGNAARRGLIHFIDQITNGELQRTVLQEPPDDLDSAQHAHDSMAEMGEGLTNKLFPTEPSNG